MIRSILFFALMPTLCLAQWLPLGNAIPGQTAGDRCGTSTAISADGSIVAFGARDGNSNFGEVRVFRLSDGAWTQIGATLVGESGGDQTGSSVSLSHDGSVLAIGEPFNNDLGYTSGQVRVFQNVNDNWLPLGQDLYGLNAIAEAGRSVDLSADGLTLAYGAPNTTVNGAFFAGQVRVFELQNNTWVQKGGDINGDGSIIKFGVNVTLSDDGNTIAIGQSGDPSNTNPEDTGRVKVYQFVGNQWIQLGNTLRGTAGRDEFGFTVRLSAAGNRVAIGSFAKSEVRVFDWVNGIWIPVGNTLVGNNLGDSFGFSLSLTGDGQYLAVGARFISLTNNDPGSVYVFKELGGNWVLIDTPIMGVAPGDQAGFSVAISENGTRVVSSSIGNDDAGNNAGHIRIFENTAILRAEQPKDVDLFEVYPNPATDNLTVRSPIEIQGLDVFTIEGKWVQHHAGSELKERSIDLTGLSSGAYMLLLHTENGVSRYRILKN